MNTSQQATILIIPGLRDHVETHWQTLLDHKLRSRRQVVSVPPLVGDKLSCAARVSAIQQALQTIEGPVIAVAHSAGVIMLAHWAQQHSQQARQIRGALLAAPPDFDHPLPAGYPTLSALQANGWLPVPQQPLHFKSLVAASTNDPLAGLARTARMARDWGSELLNVGAVGHINPASGFGEWPLAEQLIESLESCSTRSTEETT